MIKKKLVNLFLITTALVVLAPAMNLYANDINFAGKPEYRDKHMTPEQKRKKEVRERRVKLRDMQEKTKSEVFYLKSNMWFEKENNFVSTNFHRGIIIPIGSEVKIERFGGCKIKFKVLPKNGTYTYIHAKKHSKIDLYELFDRYFSEDNPLEGDFLRLSKEEQRNIKEGKITTEMSKKAVLMAYGYPPSHKTSSISSNVWTYWESRAKKILVKFKDDKVVAIE